MPDPAWPPERLQQEILVSLSRWLSDQAEAARARPETRDPIFSRVVQDLSFCFLVQASAKDEFLTQNVRDLAFILLERPLVKCGIRSLPLLLSSARRVALRALKAPEALASLSTSATALPKVTEKLDAMFTGRYHEYSVQTGLRDLDWLMGGGLPKGEMTLIGAASGHGKTALALQIAWTVAKREPEQIAYVCSPEMKSEDLWIRLAQRECRISRDALYGAKPDTVDEMLAMVGRISQQTNLVLLDREDGDATISEAIEAAHITHATRGALSLVVLDYAQQLAPITPETQKMPRYLEVGNVALQAVELARETGAAVLLTSQVNVAKDKEGNIVDTSFRESATLEHKATVALLMAPDKEARRMKLKVRKSRHGPQGQVELYYEPECYLLGDLEANRS